MYYFQQHKDFSPDSQSHTLLCKDGKVLQRNYFILWKRGFINSKRWRHYHWIVLDDNNEMVEELSLEQLMSGCTDFVDEVSQL
jgi:hypothetical protein